MLFYWLLVFILKCNSIFGEQGNQQLAVQEGTATTAVGGNITNTEYSRCGETKKKQTRIIGGLLADSGDWPWIAALGYRSSTNPKPQFMCQANLISNQWLVTAAHCVNNTGKFVLTTARLGNFEPNVKVEDNATYVDIPIDEVIPHPDYSIKPITNDIALIRLKNPINVSESIHPTCILSEPEHKNETFYSKKMTYLVKWETWKASEKNPLLEISLSFVDNKKCAESYKNQTSALINERVLCVDSSYEDGCKNSAAGSLNMIKEGRGYLVGISSFLPYNSNCNGRPSYPEVYTKVAYFAEWIKSIANL